MLEGTKIKPYKLKQQTSTEAKEEPKLSDDKIQVEIVEQPLKVEEPKKVEEDDQVKDAWDAETSEDEIDRKFYFLVNNFYSFIVQLTKKLKVYFFIL